MIRWWSWLGAREHGQIKVGYKERKKKREKKILVVVVVTTTLRFIN